MTALPRSLNRYRAGLADFVDRHVPLERRVVLVPFEDVAEIADAGGRQRPDGPRRDRVAANPTGAQVDGDVADAGLERCLGHAHDVVVRHHLFGAVIGESEQAAAVGHQPTGPPANGGEGVARDLHRAAKIGQRGVKVAALELVLVGESHRVDHEINAPPHPFELTEDRIQRGAVGDVARQHHVGTDRLRERFDPFAERVPLVGQRQPGTGASHRLGDAPGQRTIVGDPHDQALLARHQGCWHRSSNPHRQGRRERIQRREGAKRSVAAGRLAFLHVSL